MYLPVPQTADSFGHAGTRHLLDFFQRRLTQDIKFGPQLSQQGFIALLDLFACDG